MSNSVRLDGGAASSTSTQPSQDQETATPLATCESFAKQLDKTAQENAAALAIQKMFASAAQILTKATTQKGEARSDSSATSSLPDLPAPTGPLDLNNLLKALAFETRKQACKDGVNSLEGRSKDQEKLGIEQLEELSKQIAAMEKKDFWGGILKIFQWIGAAIGVIAAVASLAVGIATANPALITAGIIGSIMAVESIVSQATDGKVSLLNGITELLKVCGVDEEAAQIAGMAIQMAIMVAAIAVSVVSAVKQVGSKAVELSSKLSEQIFNIAMKSQLVLNITSAALAGVQGSLGIANAIFQNEAEKTKANTKELEALMEQVRMAFENEQTLLKNEMERVSTLLEKVSELVRNCNNTQTKIVSTAPAMA